MKTHLRSTLMAAMLSLTLASPLFTSAVVQAAPPEAAAISKREAVVIAKQTHEGKILRVKRRGPVYRVRMLSEQGEVRIIVINAFTGRVLSR